MNKFLFCIVVCSALNMTNLFADEQVIQGGESTAVQYIPSALSADVGLNGLGIAINWDLGSHTNLILGYEHGIGDLNWQNHVNISENKYQVHQHHYANTYINAIYYPWGRSEKTIIQSTYITGGAGYIRKSYSLNIDNRNVPVSYRHSISPYVGLGIRALLTPHWGAFGEIGAYYLGQPHVDTDQSYIANQLKNEHQYQWLPVAKIGIIYKF